MLKGRFRKFSFKSSRAGSVKIKREASRCGKIKREASRGGNLNCDASRGGNLNCDASRGGKDKKRDGSEEDRSTVQGTVAREIA